MQVSAVDAINKKMVIGRNGDTLNGKDYLGCSSVDLSLRSVLIRSNEGKQILDADGRVLNGVTISKHSRIQPQETVYIISEEIINVPAGYVAYVFLKNRFSQKGLLAFNTGIVDGGFKGPISTLLTNISAEEIDLKTVNDGNFFRVVFHKIDMNNIDIQNVTKSSYSYDVYLNYKAEELLCLPRYFQNPDKIKSQIEKSLNEKALNFGVMRLGLIIGFAGVLMVLVPPFIQLASDRWFGTEMLRKESWELKNQEYDKRIKSIEIELINLKKQNINIPVDNLKSKKVDDTK